MVAAQGIVEPSSAPVAPSRQNNRRQFNREAAQSWLNNVPLAHSEAALQRLQLDLDPRKDARAVPETVDLPASMVQCDKCGGPTPHYCSVETRAKFRGGGKMHAVFDAVVIAMKTELKPKQFHRYFCYHSVAIVLNEGEGPWSILERWKREYLIRADENNYLKTWCDDCWISELHRRHVQFKLDYGDEPDEDVVDAAGRAMADQEASVIYAAKDLIYRMSGRYIEGALEGLSLQGLIDLAATVQRCVLRFNPSITQTSQPQTM